MSLLCGGMFICCMSFAEPSVIEEPSAIEEPPADQELSATQKQKPSAQQQPSAKESPSAQRNSFSIKKTHVKRFEFRIKHLERGQTLKGQDAIYRLLKNYENSTLSSAEIYNVAREVTKLLIEMGYVNSGAVIPNQKIMHGVVYIDIICGRLQDIELSGVKHLSSQYVKRFFKRFTEEPLNIHTLQTQLKNFKQQAYVSRIDAAIKPTDKKGLAVLKLSILEVDTSSVSIALSNNLSPNVGEVLLDVAYINNNLFGKRDQLQLLAGSAQGLQKFGLSYSWPLADRHRVFGRVEGSDSRVVSGAFKDLEMEGKMRHYELGYQWALIHNARSVLTNDFSFNRYDSDNYLLGEPFNPVGEEGEAYAYTNAFNIAPQFSLRGKRNHFSLRADIELGRYPEQKMESYALFQSQAFWRLRIGFLNSRFLIRGGVQFASNNLPPYRKFALGGENSVRGYRTNLYTGDNGIKARLEWRMATRANTFSIAPFYDVGSTWQHGTDSADEEVIEISSVGLKFDWRPFDSFIAQLSIAARMEEKDREFVDPSIQDDGIGFRLEYQY